MTPRPRKFAKLIEKKLRNTIQTRVGTVGHFNRCKMHSMNCRSNPKVKLLSKRCNQASDVDRSPNKNLRPKIRKPNP